MKFVRKGSIDINPGNELVPNRPPSWRTHYASLSPSESEEDNDLVFWKVLRPFVFGYMLLSVINYTV